MNTNIQPTRKMKPEDIRRIHSLLDRYYGGETSADENRELLSLLDRDDLPAELHADREMARHLATLLPPDDFEKRLSEKINSMAALSEEQPAAHRQSWTKVWWSVAASVAILVCIGIGLISHPTKQQSMEMTPEEAYAHTEMALQTFAEALNKGYAQMEKADKATAAATSKAFKSLESIGIHIESN